MTLLWLRLLIMFYFGEKKLFYSRKDSKYRIIKSVKQTDGIVMVFSIVFDQIHYLD